MILILLSALFGRYIDCKNMHGMHNIKKNFVVKHPVAQGV
jgi:hypothetical protein